MRIEVLASGSTGNSYWVSDGHTHLLLDCGVSRRTIADYVFSHKLPGVGGVLVSHAHADHSKAVKELLRMGRDVYMSPGTEKALGVEGRVKTLRPGVQRAIGSWLVTPFLIEHDAPEPLGIRLYSDVTHEAVLYATDTQWVNPRHGDGCVALMLEANFSLEKIKANVASGEIDPARKHRALWNHQSIDTVLKFLQETDRSRLQQVILLHLSDENSDAELFKKRVAEICGCPVRIA